VSPCAAPRVAGRTPAARSPHASRRGGELLPPGLVRRCVRPAGRRRIGSHHSSRHRRDVHRVRRAPELPSAPAGTHRKDACPSAPAGTHRKDDRPQDGLPGAGYVPRTTAERREGPGPPAVKRPVARPDPEPRSAGAWRTRSGRGRPRRHRHRKSGIRPRRRPGRRRDAPPGGVQPPPGCSWGHRCVRYRPRRRRRRDLRPPDARYRLGPAGGQPTSRRRGARRPGTVAPSRPSATSAARPGALYPHGSHRCGLRRHRRCAHPYLRRAHRTARRSRRRPCRRRLPHRPWSRRNPHRPWSRRNPHRPWSRRNPSDADRGSNRP
jgi:hypothetical protein